MPIIKWDPFNELDRILEDRSWLPFPRIGWDMAIDVFQEDGNVIAKMNLPGITPEELEITVDEDLLTISGERREEQESDKRDYYSKEIRRGSFSRSVHLPRLVDPGSTDARYHDGVLTVTMPVVEGKSTKGVRIEVKKLNSS